MYKFIIMIGLCGLFAASFAMAEKPADKGNNVKKHEQVETKQKLEESMEENSGGKLKHEEKLKKQDQSMNQETSGKETQPNQKGDREQKELDKGSEQGQASREEHSRKWWKFWEQESQ